MYQKFQFAHQPEHDPCHPDHETIYSGVIQEDIEGNRHVVNLYINGEEYPVNPPQRKPGQPMPQYWAKFIDWLDYQVSIHLDPSPEAQARIQLPEGNDYDLSYEIRRRINAIKETAMPGESVIVTAQPVSVGNAREVQVTEFMIHNIENSIQ